MGSEGGAHKASYAGGHAVTFTLARYFHNRRWNLMCRVFAAIDRMMSA